MGFPDGLVGKESPLMQEIWFLDQEDSLEKKVAIHSSALVWEIPWTEDPGGLQSVGSQRVGHDWTTTYNCNKKLNKKEHDFMIYIKDEWMLMLNSDSPTCLPLSCSHPRLTPTSGTLFHSAFYFIIFLMEVSSFGGTSQLHGCYKDKLCGIMSRA